MTDLERRQGRDNLPAATLIALEGFIHREVYKVRQDVNAAREARPMNQKNGMDVASPAVREFFEQYARSRSATDIAGIVSQYADTCMLAAHDGVRVAQRQELVEGFPKVLEFLKTVGHTSTTLASLSEARVDEHYAMVRAQVVWRFEKAAAPPIDVTVDSAFILYLGAGVPRIVFHHEHEDFFQMLRTRGVLPAQG